MKRLTVVAVLVGGALVGALFLHTVTVRADDMLPLSEEHKQRIVANCTSSKASLRQLHRSDASLRVNSGQQYEFIGTKLMARLNGRIALNRLDGGQLVDITARYDRALASFRTTYRTYEEQLAATLRINCENQPEAFYYSVMDARSKRASVYADVSTLNQLVQEYYQSFGQFAANYNSTVPKESGDE